MASDGTLSAKEYRFIRAVLAGYEIPASATIAGVSERTGWRWLSRPTIRRELARHQEAVLGIVARRMAREMGAALDVLSAIMLDTGATDSARVSAARAVLDSGLRLTELVTLADRVDELERRMGDVE